MPQNVVVRHGVGQGPRAHRPSPLAGPWKHRGNAPPPPQTKSFALNLDAGRTRTAADEQARSHFGVWAAPGWDGGAG